MYDGPKQRLEFEEFGPEYEGQKIYPIKKNQKRGLQRVVLISLLLAVLLGLSVAGGMFLGSLTFQSQLHSSATSSQTYQTSSCDSSASSPNNPTSKLPNSHLSETIADMKVGKTDYTVPWALEVFPNRNAYLDVTFDVTVLPEGTSDMVVTRTAQGYTVILAPDFQYDTTTDTSMCNLVPVTIEGP